MNKKIVTISLICIAMFLFIPLTHAGPSDIVTVWADKAEYSPGQTGKLYIAYNNLRDSPITIRNISIVFGEWWAYVNNGWVGNLTYIPAENEKTMTERTVRTIEIGFTVPSDGRAKSTSVDIKVYTNLPTYDRPSVAATPMIYVSETPVYMDQLITLFTIQVVLLIVCTIIIAATIFLSARRPQVMWKKEEKRE